MPNEQPLRRAAPTQDSLLDRLRQAFRSAMFGGRGVTDELRTAVCDYVLDLRQQGVTPETAVISIKDVVRRTMIGQTPTHDTRRDADALVERVVTLCIEEYYRGTDGHGAVVS